MRFSYTFALLLAPLALASPFPSPAPSPSPSPDSLSINQRDVSAAIEARQQPVSQRINTLVEEGQKVKVMFQKYEGGIMDSISLYRQFKRCYKSVQQAEKAAKESGPFGDEESGKVKEALERLTPEFVAVSKAVQDKEKMITGTRYNSYFVTEIRKLQVNVKTFYTECQIKAIATHQPRIKALASEADDQFVKALDELTGRSKAQRSLETRSDEKEFEAPVEHFEFPGFPDFPTPSEFPGLPDFNIPKGFPGFPSRKRSLESRSDEGDFEEPMERFHMPWAKRSEFSFDNLPSLFESFLTSSDELGDNEAMFLPMKTGFSVEKGMEILQNLVEMVESQTFGDSGSQEESSALLRAFMDQIMSLGDAKTGLGMY